VNNRRPIPKIVKMGVLLVVSKVSKLKLRMEADVKLAKWVAKIKHQYDT